MKRPRFLFDVESASPLDLRVVGAFRYWEHPETRIICLYHRIDDGPLHRWRPGDPVPVFDPSSRFVAHNYLFEYPCWQHKLGPLFGWGDVPPLSQWDCTMARALYWGLPAALGDACDALNLPVTKDKGARPLMLRMMRPRRGAGDKYTWWHETDDDKLARLEAYCGQDVLAECALDDALPELPEFEREIFEIDGEINLRGVAIDPKLIELLINYTEEETDRLDAEMRTLTEGRVKSTNQVGALKLELENLGAVLPDLMRETVFHAVTDPGTPPAARELLLRRQEAAKTSTAKLLKMRGGMSPDQRCRGLLQYGGAGRTMRWAGRRVQPQNFPRGTVKNIASVYPLIESSIPRDDLDMLLPGSIMDMAASALRGCFVASPGHVLVSGDLAQIEARVLAWLAGQEDVLDVFRSGEDIYRYSAAQQGSTNRDFGKVKVLACGFGMGPPKFQDTAAKYGVVLTIREAEDGVASWRDHNQQSVKFWWNVYYAFKNAVESAHGTEIQVGQFLTIRKTRQAVRIVLPSSHEITYQFVELTPNANNYSGKPDITFMGVDQKTHKWSRQRTYGGKLVENIVQATARDVLGVAMKRVRARGAPIVLTVHDELLTEAPEHSARGHLAALLADMTTAPEWAPGLPVWAAGWTGRRYRK